MKCFIVHGGVAILGGHSVARLCFSAVGDGGPKGSPWSLRSRQAKLYLNLLRHPPKITYWKTNRKFLGQLTVPDMALAAQVAPAGVEDVRVMCSPTKPGGESLA